MIVTKDYLLEVSALRNKMIEPTYDLFNRNHDLYGYIGSWCSFCPFANGPFHMALKSP